MGSLISDSYAMGIHREQQLRANAPFFLAELRRRLFAKFYHVDKVISTWFDRPARILRRYSDTRMPLDLTDEDLLSDGPQLAEARSQLEPDGWNLVNSSFKTTVWARTRYILGPVREKILECAYLPRPLSDEHRDKLKRLSAWSHEIWQGLPSHVVYTKECWTSGIPMGVCNMLTLVYLGYLQMDFQIQRLLDPRDECSTQPFARAAGNMLATVLQLGIARDRTFVLRHDYEFVVSATHQIRSADRHQTNSHQ